MDFEESLEGIEGQWFKPARGKVAGYEPVSPPGSLQQTHLAPTSGVKWEAYDVQDLMNDRVTPLYMKLADLDTDDPHTLADRWFNQHGPLGLLPHTVEKVIRWPRWEIRGDEVSVFQPVWTLRRFNSLRNEARHQMTSERLDDLGGPGEDGEALDADSYRALLEASGPYTGLQRTQVRFNCPMWRKSSPGAPVGEYHALFFPDVDGVRERALEVFLDHDNRQDPFEDPLQKPWYPLPHRAVTSQKYRNRYGEPLHLIRGAVDLMGHILRWLAGDGHTYVKTAVNRALAEARMVPPREPGSPVRWRFSSLWSALVLRAVQDHAGQGIKICPHCGDVFLAEGKRKYCSDSHRDSYIQKKHRERKKQRNSKEGSE